jgi:hypothetical protein
VVSVGVRVGVQGAGAETGVWVGQIAQAGKMGGGMAVCSAAGLEWALALRPRSLLGHWDIPVVAWVIYLGMGRHFGKVGSD